MKQEPEPEVRNGVGRTLQRPSKAYVQFLNERPQMKFMIVGQTGWIGGLLGELLTATNCEVVYSQSRMENRTSFLDEIRASKPTNILLAAGVTHGKGVNERNIDFCETHKAETIRANVIGTINVVDLCVELGIHCTVFATGCIYDYQSMTDKEISIFDGFTEEDEPNFHSSFYSQTKMWSEEILKAYHTIPNAKVLILRVRMPIGNDLHSRSLITKLAGYSKVINVENSVSVLHDLLPTALILAKQGHCGVLNLTNPETISHDKVLRLYKQYVDQQHDYTICSVKEVNGLLKAPRCNNKLNVDKLQQELKHLGLKIPSASVAVQEVFEQIAETI